MSRYAYQLRERCPVCSASPGSRCVQVQPGPRPSARVLPVGACHEERIAASGASSVAAAAAGVVAPLAADPRQLDLFGRRR